MTAAPILASDTTAALALPVAIVGCIGFLGFASIFVTAKWGRRRWWGLLLGLFPTLVGGILLLLVAISGALGFFYVVAAFPLLCGLGTLYFWSRKPQPPSLNSKVE